MCIRVLTPTKPPNQNENMFQKKQKHRTATNIRVLKPTKPPNKNENPFQKKHKHRKIEHSCFKTNQDKGNNENPSNNI